MNFMANRFVITKMESYSISSGTVFQFNWNSIPANMEQASR
ncbi:hypothetical protein HMPREF6745_1240 [Prevotella sp. oral taxon 472 str. F0295]|nr:hypothetical protein HMPREF6745_1240 [Prevotella sp. oral taxon 472 str. F0295]